jgi:hypothetical protein
MNDVISWIAAEAERGFPHDGFNSFLYDAEDDLLQREADEVKGAEKESIENLPAHQFPSYSEQRTPAPIPA